MESILIKNKLSLHYKSSIRIRDKIYFSEAFFNGLFELDTNDFSIKFLCHFSEEDKRKLLLHGGHPIQYKNIIYFFPTCTARVHCYDIVKKEEHNISIPLLKNKEEFGVIGIVQRGHKIWLFSIEASIGVFVLDMEENSIVREEVLSRLLSKYQKVTNFIETKEDKIFTYCTSENKLLEVDIENENIKEYEIPIKNINIGSINYYREMFYFIDERSGDLFEWKLGNTYLQRYVATGLENALLKGPPFSNCCFVNGNIYMIPFNSNYVMKVIKDKKVMEKAFDFPDDFEILKKIREYKPAILLSFEVINNEIWFHPYGGNQLLIYNTISEQVVGKNVNINIENVFPCRGLNYENKRFLEYYLLGVKKNMMKHMIAESSYGRKIYQKMNI